MAEKKKPAPAGKKPAAKSAPKSGSKPAAKKPAAKPASKPSSKPSPKRDDKPAKPAAKKPASKPAAKGPGKPAAKAGSKPTGKPAAKSGGKPAGKPTGKPAAKSGGKPSGKPAGKPTGKPAGKPTGKPTGKPAAKKSSGPTKPQTHAERRREEKAMAEPKSAKPRPASPRKSEGGAPKRLPKEAVLAGVQPQPKTVKRPGAKKASRPDPEGVRAAMRLVAGWLHDKKALDIMALDVAGLCSVAEGLVLATARNVRQAQALADHVLKTAGESGISYLGMEGYRTGTWVLLDLNDVLVHVFQEDSRRFYNLEGLWADAAALDLGLEPDDAGPSNDKDD